MVKAYIKIAKKEFFPSFNITGFYTFNTFGPGNFFSWESIFAAFILGATQDIFTGGRKLANLKFKKARYKELLEDFLQKDLEAIKEVNDALYASKYDLNILKNAQEKLYLNNENLKFDNLKYQQGEISLLDVLYSTNETFETKKDLVDAKSKKFINLISLYKASGGGI